MLPAAPRDGEVPWVVIGLGGAAAVALAAGAGTAGRRRLEVRRRAPVGT